MDYILPFVPQSIKNIPTHMDFDGQKRAEKYFQLIILAFAAVGFVCGYITQYFSHTLYILFVGVAISSVLTLFPWSTYRSQPLDWQPVQSAPDSTTQGGKGAAPPSSGASQAQKKKKKLKD